MRIIYMGSPEEAISPLNYLLASKSHEVIAVISQPPRQKGRGREQTDPPVAVFAKSQNIPVYQPIKASSPDFIVELIALAPDVIVTCAYGQILSEAFLQIPLRATINIHPSLLPKYRGATPVASAVLNGETITGVTILFTVRALDAGNIILQRTFPIGAEERANELLQRLFDLSGPLLVEALDILALDSAFVGIPQSASQVTHCSKLSKEMGKVDWTLPASTLFQNIKGLHPWPGSFSFFNGRRVIFEKVYPSPLIEAGDEVIGEITYNQAQQIFVQTGAGKLELLELKIEGKGKITPKDFINGFLRSSSNKENKKNLFI